jgi:peptidyl-prolyl cis-trans isomerase C
LRAKVPAPDALPAQEIRAYYDAHRADYQEPERRRVSAIVVGSETQAKALIEKAKQASPSEFGELVRKHSLVRTPGENLPLELEGDLGIVSRTASADAQEPKLPDAVHAALFEIGKVGEVYGKPVAGAGRYYVLRMTGRTEARTRTFAEAERSIRVRIVDERIAAAETQLVEQLKKSTPVTIDDAALAKLRATRQAKEEKLRDAIRP